MHTAIKKFSEKSAQEMQRIFSESADLKSLMRSAANKELTDAEKEELGTFEMVITTEAVDRYGDSIKLDGWNLKNYMNNPVVLWGHDYWKLPVGVTTELEVKDGKLIARGYFASAEMNPEAQYVRRLYDAGLMRASSVGLLVLKREGNDIVEAELLEWSFVTVPANPEALTLAADSLDMAPKAVLAKGFLTREVSEEDEDDEEEDDGASAESEVEDDIDEVDESGDTSDESGDEQDSEDDDTIDDETETLTDDQKNLIESAAQEVRDAIGDAVTSAFTKILSGQTAEKRQSNAGDLSKAKEVINIDSKGAESNEDQQKRYGYLQGDVSLRNAMKTINTLTRKALEKTNSK